MRTEENNHEKEQLRKELEEIAPSLAAMKKTNPFGLPENYFSGLEYRVMQQIKREEAPKAIEIGLSDRIKFWWDKRFAVLFSGRIVAPVMASILVLTVSLFFLHQALVNSSNRSTDNGLEFSGLSNEELSSYVINHADEFDLADIDPETLNNVAHKYKLKNNGPGSQKEEQKAPADDVDDQTPNEEVL
jgi:hypothetical protein